MAHTNIINEAQGHFLFYEEQRFRQPWLWALLGTIALLLVGLFGYGLYQQLILGKPWGDKPMSDLVLVTVTILAWGVQGTILYLLFSMTLKVGVDTTNIYIHFTPFSKRVIPLSDIQNCEARTYNPLLEYGGWGVRSSWRAGMAYNAMGDRGVQLQLKDGKKVLIGSQRSEELSAVILRGMRHLKQ